MSSKIIIYATFSSLLNDSFTNKTMIAGEIAAYKVESHCSVYLSIVRLKKDCLSVPTLGTRNLFGPGKGGIKREILHHRMFSHRRFYQFVSVHTERVCFLLVIAISARKIKSFYGTIFPWIQHIVAFWTEFDGHVLVENF